MNISSLIIARGGSKGLPNKHMLKLGGKTLIELAVTKSIQAGLVTYFSSDSQEYLGEARKWGAVVIKRPPELAQDDTPAIKVVQHALPLMGNPDSVLLLSACCPLVSVEDIKGAIALLGDSDSVVGLTEAFEAHPSKVCTLENGIVKPLGKFETGQRQELEQVYRRNACIYIAKREVLESGTFFGPVTKGYVMPRERSVDINDRTDYLLTQFFYEI